MFNEHPLFTGFSLSGENLLDARAPFFGLLGVALSLLWCTRGIQKAARVTETNENRCFSCFGCPLPFEEVRSHGTHPGRVAGCESLWRGCNEGGSFTVLSGHYVLTPSRRLLFVEWMVGSPVCGVRALVYPKHSNPAGRKTLTWKGQAGEWSGSFTRA